MFSFVKTSEYIALREAKAALEAQCALLQSDLRNVNEQRESLSEDLRKVFGLSRPSPAVAPAASPSITDTPLQRDSTSIQLRESPRGVLQRKQSEWDAAHLAHEMQEVADLIKNSKSEVQVNA